MYYLQHIKFFEFVDKQIRKKEEGRRKKERENRD
jgi:hypothetical protein